MKGQGIKGHRIIRIEQGRFDAYCSCSCSQLFWLAVRIRRKKDTPAATRPFLSALYPSEPADYTRETDSRLTVVENLTLYPITSAPIPAALLY